MKKLLIFSLILTVTFVFVPSCKKVTTIKEVNNPDISLYGTWKVLSSDASIYRNVKYLSFSTNRMSTTYSNYGIGFNYSSTSSLQPYADQFVADLDGSGQGTVHNYHRNGDTLIIELGEQLAFKAIKANESEVSSWVTEITSTDEIAGVITNMRYGIGADGSNLLVPDYDNNKIIKISLATRIPSGTIPVNSVYPYTVEFDGTDIWCSDDGGSYIYRFPAAGGAQLSKSPKLGPWVYGIAYDPGMDRLWAFAHNTDTVYQFAKTGNTVLGRYGMGTGINDMAWSNGRLYVTFGSYIYRVNTSTGFVVEKAYKFKSGFQLYGIAAVGSDFWLNVDGDKLVKVKLD